MSPPEKKRIRAYKPKSRNGCITCKARRIKCDEEKPFCARCSKFGVRCEGYVLNLPGPKTTKRHSTREILPRTSQVLALLAPSILKRPAATTVFEDSREYAYFLYFQEETAIELSGSFDASLWNHVVLQACQNEPSLSRLTASLGALNKATRLRAMTSCQEEQASSHLQYALWEYGRALKGIYKKISANKSRESVRIALVASLLIFCFENLSGNLEAAIANAESALQLLRKQLSRIRLRYRHIQTVSPTPDFEDDLVAAFVRLDNALMSRPDHPSATTSAGSSNERPIVLDVTYSNNIHEIPYRFRNITQARNYLENFQFRALPSLAHEFAVQIDTSPQTVDELVRDTYESLTAESQQWKAAFAPLYAEARTPAGRKDFVAATTLRTQALSTEIAARRICARGMSSSDAFVAESREIIDLSKLVITDPSFRKTFVFDCGVVPSLFIVVITCQDLSLRKEALEVLRQTVPRREGAWDSLVLLKIGERVLQAEEEEA